MKEEEFIRHIEEGYQLIPVSKAIDNLNLDPIDVYENLADKSKSYLFESLEGQKDWSRYTIIGLPSNDYIEVSQNQIRIYENNQLVKKVMTENPIKWIENYHKSFRVYQDSTLPQFQGGLVGYFGFDTIKYFEPNIKYKTQKDTMETPDICLIVSKKLLIFDKIKNAINIIIYAENNLDSFLQAEKEILDKIDYLNKFSKPHNFTNQKEINEDIKISYDLEKNDFISSVKKIKQYIMNGDAMQVVLSQRMSMPFYNKPISFYRELRSLNPSPYMYYLNMGDHHIVGSSPEILVRLEDNLITVRPIAGTRPRGKNAVEDDLLAIELKNDSKEIAEHLMLIDLGRNDVGKVSKIGSIKLTDKMIIEKYSHVMHMVSNVTGDILDNLGMMDVLKSTFPAGTVSGAPKFRAIEIIYELESIKRGIYAGAIGYLGWNGNMDTAIAIRTCVIKDGILHIQCGAGIVNDSVPELEWDETINKGKAIVQAYKNLRIKKI
ncbi:MAG: Anthranilate synthase component 1 [Gammaproteobacteria bacterium]|nr:MAG: Anthranilate synthase component 1 [Gammaproteobacteria bacterium]